MDYHIIYPSSSLEPYIDFYKCIEFPNQFSAHSEFTGYPSGYVDLVLPSQPGICIEHQGGERGELSGVNLIGHFDQYFKVRLESKMSVIWIRMKPHGAYILTGVSGKLFHNRWVALDDIKNKLGQKLQEKLFATSQTSARIALIESFLQEQIATHYQRDGKLEHIISLILANKGQVKLKEICLEVGLSYRGMDRLFWEKIGQSPKRATNHIRFKCILNEIREQGQTDWMQLVADYGFHDQAHLIKEFKKFTQLPPQKFLGRKNEVGVGLYQ